MFSTSPKKKKIMAQKFCIVTTEFANDHLRGPTTAVADVHL